MAKSNYERLLEKQIKQEKDAQRKREREAREDAVRQRAAAVVGGQPVIGGMRKMDDAAEELLRIILSQYNNDDNRCVRGDVDLFPSSYRFSLSVEFEKLRMYGVLSSHGLWLSGTWEATLAPQGITYFTDKEQAQKRHEEEQKMRSIGNITNYGNMVFGSVTGSTLSVDNSIHQIDEKGGGRCC